MMDSTLSIKNASGKTFSLLNDNSSQYKVAPFKVNKLTASLVGPISSKRKYHCLEPGCNKSFTTSGHLARHNRIHTGEKNFHCLHPGCPSRFSRQDNMMQHYRTHLSQKSRRPHGRYHHKKLVHEDLKNYNLPHIYNYPESSFQTLNRPRRSSTMPSLPFPTFAPPPIMNRPRRALSTSSSCSSDSNSTLNLYPKQVPILPPLNPSASHFYDHPFNPPSSNPSPEWNPNNQKPLTNLLHLANIVSSIG